MDKLSWRVSAGAAGIALLLATGAVAAVPASAAPRAGTVTCPTVNPTTGAVTPKPGHGEDWSGCDLAGANLSRAPLDFSNLSDTNLTGVNFAHGGFEEVDFTGAKFTGASGNNADFEFAEFAKADLAGVTLRGAAFYSADFTSASLVRADLDHSKLSGITATGADFSRANLTSDDLSNGNYSGADLADATLAHASVANIRLAGARLAGATSGGLSGIPTSLPAGFSVSGGFLIGPYANLAGANLSGVFAVNDTFTHANLTKTSLAGADLASADFAGADLAGASLKGADLSGAELTATNANLQNVAWSTATTCPNGHPASAKTGCFAKPAVARPPAITVSVRRGVPATTLTLTGSGFAANEPLTVSFGPTRLTTVTTSKTGIAGPVTLTIPASAQPGLHQITATGRAKGQSAASWFTVAADWDQARFDSGLTSDNTIENTLSPAKTPALAKKFIFNPGAGTAGAFAASIDDGAAFVASTQGPLTAINAATGKTLWTWKEPGSWDSANTTPHDQLSQPVVINGIAYVSVAGQGIVAVGSGGKLLWTSSLEDGEYPNPPAVNLSQPTLADGLLYATNDDNLFSVNPVTGFAVSWAEPAPPQATPWECGQPAVGGGVVYLRCNNGNLYAFSAAALTALWSYPVPGNPQIGSTAVSGGSVYVTTTSASADELIAISTSTHTQEWSFKAAAALNAPAIAGNVVYAVAHNGVLYALNATTGTLLWSKLIAKNSGSDTYRPSVADGVVYAMSANGAAAAFNAKTGARLWSYQAGSTLRAAPVVANGILYIGTRSGGAEAFTAR